MHRNNRKGILMGAGLLGIGTVLGFSTAAQAAPRNDRNRNDVKEERRDVKEARKDVKDARKDVRKSDNPYERREAVQDYREAQRDLNREQHDLRNERRDDNRKDNRWDNGRKPDWNRNNGSPNVFNRPNYVPPRNNNGGYNSGYNPRTGGGYNPSYNGGYRPGYNGGHAPGYSGGYNGSYNGGYNPGYNAGNNGAWGTQTVTIEGTVISNNAGRSFTLRSTNGQVWQVQVQGSAPAGLDRGDVVRVFGPTRGLSVLATGLRILQNY